MINTILFDLDGTLLPLDTEKFLELYFEGLSNKIAGLGLDIDNFRISLMLGIKAMQINDGKVTNEEAFWKTFKANIIGDIDLITEAFNNYYINDFDEVKASTYVNPQAKVLVDILKSKGYRLILATNPIFPRIATLKRISWAGLNPLDFDIITTFENYSYTKPNNEYYKAILNDINKEASEVIMIGNDAHEDMHISELGSKVFLLTDCLINSLDKDLSIYPQGGFEELSLFLKEVLEN